MNNFCSQWMPKQYRTGDRWTEYGGIPLKGSVGVNSLLVQKLFIRPCRWHGNHGILLPTILYHWFLQSDQWAYIQAAPVPIKSHKPPNRTIIWLQKLSHWGIKACTDKHLSQSTENKLFRPAVVTIEAMDISFMTVSIHFRYKLVLRHFCIGKCHVTG